MLPAPRSVDPAAARRSNLVRALRRALIEPDDTLIDDLLQRGSWQSHIAGDHLIRKGDPVAHFFLTVAGRLHVLVDDGQGGNRVVEEVVIGETLGEMELLTDSPAYADVVVTRDTELLALAAADFHALGDKHPALLRAIAAGMVGRIQQTVTGAIFADDAAFYTFIYASDELAETAIAADLAAAINAIEPTPTVSRSVLAGLTSDDSLADVTHEDPRHTMLSGWFTDLEQQFGNVVLEADPTLTPWTRRCLRLADHLVIFARAGGDPSLDNDEAAVEAYYSDTYRIPHTLIIVHPPDSTDPLDTLAWLDNRPAVSQHLHIRAGNLEDLARAARYLTGNAIGLALAGGGAKGFAHYGVIKALNELNIPIDMVGGTSIGGMVSSSYAFRQELDHAVSLARLGNEANLFGRFALPSYAVVPHRHLDVYYQEAMEDRDVREFWLPFFCTSTDLTTATTRIHYSGPAWFALRATSALPGLLPPMIDHERHVLVDGGVMNNLPADIMKSFARGGPVIAVNLDVGDAFVAKDDYEHLPEPGQVFISQLFRRATVSPLPGIGDILVRALMLNNERVMQSVDANADLFLTPPTLDVATADATDEALERLLVAGYDYVMAKADEIEALDWVKDLRQAQSRLREALGP